MPPYFQQEQLVDNNVEWILIFGFSILLCSDYLRKETIELMASRHWNTVNTAINYLPKYLAILTAMSSNITLCLWNMLKFSWSERISLYAQKFVHNNDVLYVTKIWFSISEWWMKYSLQFIAGRRTHYYMSSWAQRLHAYLV